MAALPARTVPVRRCSVLGAIGVFLAGMFAVSGPAIAKTPGETHCYRDVCHRVKTLSETRWWVGKTSRIKATYYDDPAVDRFNIGKYTSSGEIFDADDPTRASSSNLPDGTELLVWNPQNGRTVHVRINDFGPFHTDRKLDLTRAAAEELGMIRYGVVELHTIVVAPPPEDEPVYKRGRRYPAALGYIGVLGKRQIDDLARQFVSRSRESRLASIDIHQFLWSTKAEDLHANAALKGLWLPDAGKALHTQTGWRLASIDDAPSIIGPPSVTLEPVRRGFMPAPPPLRRQVPTRSGASDLIASLRPVGPSFDGPARFALKFAALEESGWRAPPALAVSSHADPAVAAPALRLAAVGNAPLAQLAPPPLEIALTDSDSIRWTIPGLDSFMRIMAPVWGPKVTPLQALEAAAAMALVLLMSLVAMLRMALSGEAEFVLAGNRKRGMFTRSMPAARPQKPAMPRANAPFNRLREDFTVDRRAGPVFASTAKPRPPSARTISVAQAPAPGADIPGAETFGSQPAAQPAASAPLVPITNPPDRLDRVPELGSEAEAIPLPTAAAAAQPESRIGHGLHVDGEISSYGRLVVEGVVEGHCCCQQLVIAPGGRVSGTVDAVSVEIDGVFDGTLQTSTLVVGSTGRVTGHLRYRRAQIVEGAEVEAHLSRLADDTSSDDAEASPFRFPNRAGTLAARLATQNLGGPDRTTAAATAGENGDASVFPITRSSGPSLPSLTERLQAPYRSTGA